MKNRNRTKKLRKKLRKRQTKKIHGGANTDTKNSEKEETTQEKKTDIDTDKPDTKESKNNEAIMDEVKNENKLEMTKLKPDLNLGDSSIAQKTNDLAKGVTVNAIESTGNLLGVDFSNPDETSKKLDDIKKNISSPENVEKMTEIVGEAVQVGSVALEAAEPFTKPMINKSAEIIEEAGSKIGKAGVNIILNTAEEIPGVGVVIGTIRTISKIGEAGLAATDAASELVTTSSNSINATSKNFNELMKEKEDVVKRTDDSVKEFEAPLKNTTPNDEKVPTGGAFSKRNSKKQKRKTKRVRFAL